MTPEEPVFTFGLHSVKSDDNNPWGELDHFPEPKALAKLWAKSKKGA